MKKALIAIISAIYVVAIIIVAFLGSRADIYNRTVYAEEIVLLNENIVNPDTGDVAIEVYKRPEESHIDPDTGIDDIEGINWNYGEKKDQKRDYAIFVYDTNFLYDTMGKTYALKTSVKPDDTTKKDLEYFIAGGDKVVSTLSINNVGEISFSVEYTSWVDVDVFVSTTDLSNVEIDILLKVNKYKH